MLPTVNLLLAKSFATFVIEQNLGQNVSFREQFDVAVARAVAEMRVLGNYDEFLS